MNKVSFTGDNVLSNEVANKTGNITSTLFESDEKIMGADVLGKKLEMSNPYSWNSNTDLGPQGFQDQLPAYLSQSHMSSYYQDNPWPVLNFSKKYGVKQTLGGGVRGDLPPGSYPRNIISDSKGLGSDDVMLGTTLYAPSVKNNLQPSEY